MASINLQRENSNKFLNVDALDSNDSTNFNVSRGAYNTTVSNLSDDDAEDTYGIKMLSNTKDNIFSDSLDSGMSHDNNRNGNTEYIPNTNGDAFNDPLREYTTSGGPSFTSGGHDNDNYYNGPDDSMPEEKSYEDIQKEKAFALAQLKRLEQRGHVISRRLGMEHSLNDIKGEVEKIKKEIEVERGISLCRQGLMFCVNSIEMLNNNFDPFGTDLNGWGASVHSDINNYDEIFEELYEKYNTSVSMAPEVKLIMMLGGSAFMHAMQRKLINSMETNPNVMGSFMNTFNKANDSKKDSKGPAKMKGPSHNHEELLRKLNEDQLSDISSLSNFDGKSDDGNNEDPQGSTSKPKEKPINLEKKKRGRPKKIFL